MNVPSSDPIRLPDTALELNAATDGLRAMLPNILPLDEAYTLVKEAAHLIASFGCKSDAELTARGIDIANQLELALTADEMRDALLYITFGRPPVDEADRQHLVARLVAESGGPVGVDADVVPGAAGPFGRSLTNPVPVAGIVSAELYLSRLRTPDGWPVSYRRKGSLNNGNGPVDVYILTDFFDEPLGEVFISPYHQRISALTPDGFYLDEQ